MLYILHLDVNITLLQVFFAVSKGPGLNAIVMSNEVVCDSQWHTINVTLETTALLLQIDNSPANQEKFDAGSDSLLSAIDVYIGGLPGNGVAMGVLCVDC